MSGMNEVVVEGRLGRDPEMRYTPQGNAVTQVSVATERSKKDETGAWVKDGETEWFNVKAWGKLAESVAESLHKGDVVHVHGHTETRSWEGKDGTKQYRTEVIARSVTRPLSFGPKPAGRPESDAPAELDELPF
jgi:single-strand DNA-binding protein